VLNYKCEKPQQQISIKNICHLCGALQGFVGFNTTPTCVCRCAWNRLPHEILKLQ